MDESHPDSALALLRSLRKESVRGKEVQARLALATAMALDKCFIDTADASVLQPAMVYYRGLFHRHKQFLTRYYQARILENGGQDEEALAVFAEAEMLLGRKPDSLYRTRLAAAKARIYLRNLALGQAEEAVDEGVHWAKRNTSDRENLLLDKAGHLMVQGQFERADSILSQEVLTPSRRRLRSIVRLCIDAPAYYPKYQSILEQAGEFPLGVLDTMSWAQFQHLLGHDAIAWEALEPYRPKDGIQRVSYWLVRSEMEKALGKDDEAYRSLHQYSVALEELHLRASQQDVRFAEEKYRRDQFDRKQRRIRTLWLVLFLVSTTTVLGVILYFRRKKHIWAQKVEELRSEYGALVKLRNSMEEYNNRIGQVLDTRIQALAPFLDDKPAGILDRSPELDRMLSDKKDLLCNIGLLFALYHPAFVMELERYELDYLEIGFCCLYALGFQVKEIPDILGRDAYHINPRIRKKIGLDVHATNLPIWIRDLYIRSEDER